MIRCLKHVEQVDDVLVLGKRRVDDDLGSIERCGVV